MKSKAILLFLPLVLFVALAVFLAGGLKKDPSLLPSVMVGKAFPEFDLPRLGDGSQRVTRAMFKGPALVNVWGTWCPSCKSEHPVLVELARNGVPLYGVDYKDVEASAMAYLQEGGNPFLDVVNDAQGSLGFDLGVYGAPETFMIDATGVIRHRHVGEITADAWRNDLWPRWQAMTGTNSPDGVKK